MPQLVDMSAYSVTPYQLAKALHEVQVCPLRHKDRPADECPRLLQLADLSFKLLAWAVTEPLLSGEGSASYVDPRDANGPPVPPAPGQVRLLDLLDVREARVEKAA